MRLSSTFIIIVILLPSISFAQNFNVGEKTLLFTDSTRNRPIKAELWYPTTDVDVKQKRITELPFVLEPTIREASHIEQPQPLILLSHGTGGNRFGLAWLAIALAKQGYMVIAPDHWGNTYDNKIPEYFVRYWERPLDLRFLLSQILTEAILSKYIDQDKIGMVGFSLGGYTALAMAGVEVDCQLLKEAAYTRQGKKEFTVPELGDLRKLFARLRCDSLSHSPLKDSRIKAFVALSPALGLGFETVEQTKNITAPILILVAENDQIAPVQTNAREMIIEFFAGKLKE
jgi:predicted dienelactone hydrolase